MKCVEIIQSNYNGFNHYNKCTNEAKYEVHHKSTTTGKLDTYLLCGIHFRALEKQSVRIKKRTGYDIELTFTKL